MLLLLETIYLVKEMRKKTHITQYKSIRFGLKRKLSKNIDVKESNLTRTNIFMP